MEINYTIKYVTTMDNDDVLASRIVGNFGRVNFGRLFLVTCLAGKILADPV